MPIKYRFLFWLVDVNLFFGKYFVHNAHKLNNHIRELNAKDYNKCINTTLRKK